MNHADRIRINAGLRKVFDGNDPIIRGVSVHGSHGSGHAARVARAPESDPWAFDDVKVNALLLERFPNLKTNRTQRKRASIWREIINLYFRVGKTAGETALELNHDALKAKNFSGRDRWTVRRVKDTVRRIRLAADGKRTDYPAKIRSGKMGRPRNKPNDSKSLQNSATSS